MDTDVSLMARMVKMLRGVVYLVDKTGHLEVVSTGEYMAMKEDVVDDYAVFLESDRAHACSARRRQQS
jgi:hypothetical protein